MNQDDKSLANPSPEYQHLLREHLKVVKQLHHSERMKSQFLSSIRNEIINPFGAILNLSASISQLQSGQSDKAAAMAALIHQEAFNLNFQLQNIFAAAEIEAGDICLSVTKVDVPTLVQSVIEKFRGLFTRKGLQLTLRRNADDTTEAATHGDASRFFRTDADKLDIVLCNLIANAIEFSQPGGSVEITIAIRAGMLQIAIKDEGIGMHEKDLSVIFHRFTRLDASATKEHGGHGLGLSVVKALLESLGGGTVVSSSIRSGSVFTLTIPESPLTEEMPDCADGTVVFFRGTDNQEIV
jgi:signal transduction histidine kinase